MQELTKVLEMGNKKMTIRTQVLTPHFKRLEAELSEIQRKAETETSQHALLLKDSISKNLQRLQSIQRFSADRSTMSAEELQKAFRKMKLEVRFAARQWQRIHSNESRFRRAPERYHVETIAA